MNTKDTALLLVGLQNDYFATDGKLNQYVENADTTLKNIIELVDVLSKTDMMIVFAPISFSEKYFRTSKGDGNPSVGIFNMVKSTDAFKKASYGVQIVKELEVYKDRLTTISGIHRPNVFSQTELPEVLENNNIENVVIAGAITAICIDGTGRGAFENDYSVTQLSNCTSSRTQVEQDYFCTHIFPLYARVMTSHELLKELRIQND